MSDIIDELRRTDYVMFKDGWQSKDLAARAGIEILRLREENAKLKASPDANHRSGFDTDPPTRAYVDILKAEISELRLKETGLKIAMTKIAAYEARIAELEGDTPPAQTRPVSEITGSAISETPPQSRMTENEIRAAVQTGSVSVATTVQTYGRPPAQTRMRGSE